MSKNISNHINTTGKILRACHWNVGYLVIWTSSVLVVAWSSQAFEALPRHVAFGCGIRWGCREGASSEFWWFGVNEDTMLLGDPPSAYKEQVQQHNQGSLWVRDDDHHFVIIYPITELTIKYSQTYSDPYHLLLSFQIMILKFQNRWENFPRSSHTLVFCRKILSGVRTCQRPARKDGRRWHHPHELKNMAAGSPAVAFWSMSDLGWPVVGVLLKIFLLLTTVSGLSTIAS